MERVDEHQEQAIREALVDELHVRSQASFAGLVLVIGLLAVLLSDLFARSRAMTIAFIALGCFIPLRVAAVWVASKKQGIFASARHRHLAFGIGSTVTALGLSAINVTAYGHLDGVRFATLAMCHAGINAIALVSLGSSPTLYHLYMLPMLLPMIGMSLLGMPGPGLKLLPAIFTLFVTVLSVMSLHEYRLRRDNVALRLRVSEMALVDPLTKLKNRRYVIELLANEVEAVQRAWFKGGEPKRRFWLMMIDLDHFKQVNDALGHDVGDSVLSQVGALLMDTVRKQDVVARWGGEEFLVVARDAGGDMGSALAERIRARIEAHDFALPGGRRSITCSIGYSVYPFVAASPRSLAWDDVLALADAGLYRAKHEGRNRVVGILSGETDGGRDTVDSVKNDFERARESGLVRIAN